MVCGDRTPFRLGFETFGAVGVVGRSEGGAYPVSDAWPQRYGSDWTLPSADQPSRVLLSMCRSVVVPAAEVSSLSYGVMFKPCFSGWPDAGSTSRGRLT